MKQMLDPRPRRSRRWHVHPGPPPEGGVQPYSIAGPERTEGPPLPGRTVVADTLDELIDLLAADLVVHAENCVRQFGDFHLALSGGQTPEPLYERLMYDPNYRRLPWRRTHLWMVDERCVPFDDPQSNFRMISETIVDHADIPREQVHPIFATAETADVDYERELRESLGWREKGQDRLDFVLLGVGADGHTASLFPNTAALHEQHRLALFNTASAPPYDRVTMTLPLINASRFVGVLVAGKSKADAIRRIAYGDEPIDSLPVRGVDPLNGELRWYLDAAAAGGSNATP